MLYVVYSACQCKYMLFLGTSYLFLEGDISHSGGPRPCQHCNSRAACWAEQREGAYTAFLHWQTGSRALSLQWPWDYQLQQKGKEDARVYMTNKTEKYHWISTTRFLKWIKWIYIIVERKMLTSGDKYLILMMNYFWRQTNTTQENRSPYF